jgi:hypothetical protein
MRCIPLLTLVATGLTLGACADFYSIGRTRVLPDDPGSNKGLAIHLDAQQRLMMVGKDGTYCAEASPDAMAAYAAALAGSAAAQGYGSGSMSNASQSSIASIGLRTQSITLMRDALYRLCEAGANGQVSKISAMQLMARSQDLTAVVVAVEQLTGATAAAQAMLTGTAGANAAATEISGEGQIEAAEKNLTNKQEATVKLRGKLAEKKAEVQQLGVASGEAKRKAQEAPDDPADVKQTLTAEADEADRKHIAAQQEQKLLEGQLERAEKAEKRAEEIVEKAASAGSSADSQTSASTSSEGEFAENPSREKLNDASSAAIAKSVEAMVTTVLNKDYTGADCMVLLTNITTVKVDPDHAALLDNTLKQCERLLTAKIKTEADNLVVTTFKKDENTARLRKAIDTVPGFQGRLEDWIKLNYPGGATSDLLTGDETTELRQRAVTELGAPPL